MQEKKKRGRPKKSTNRETLTTSSGYSKTIVIPQNEKDSEEREWVVTEETNWERLVDICTNAPTPETVQETYIEENLDFTKPSKEAAIVIVKNKDNRYLAVTRPGTVDKWEFPGGDVEPGEKPLYAALRELVEETNVRVINSFSLKYWGVARYKEYYVHIYCTHAANVSGEISTNEDHLIDWVEEELLKEGSFGDFNTAWFNNTLVRELTQEVSSIKSSSAIEKPPTIFNSRKPFIYTEL
jgi:8-oxo-dGTP pyrophosphatase MutT (NUDIX family)